MQQGLRLQASVPWLRPLQFGGEVHPHLDDLQRSPCFFEPFWGDFSVLNATSCGHPLDSTRPSDKRLSCGIAVGHLPVEHKGQGLKPLVRMRAKGQAAVVRRIHLRSMMVQEQERIQIRQRRCGQRTESDQVVHRRLQGVVQSHEEETTASPFRSLHVDGERFGFSRDCSIAPPAPAEPQQKSAVRMVEGKKRTIFAVLNL